MRLVPVNLIVIGHLKVSRKYLDFDVQDTILKEGLVSDTWCDKCSEADLGISSPVLFAESGRKFVEGKCLICKTACKMEIFEEELDENEHPDSL